MISPKNRWLLQLATYAAAFGAVASGLLAATTPNEPAPVAPAGYRLVWADEFNRDGPLDPKNWNFEQGFERNEELQWYRAENARCEGGLLIIEARREKVPNPKHDPASKSWKRRRPHADYTSASATTRGLQSWLYGRFEVRARIDARAGMWPAIWTLGVEGNWPANGEIDLMEYYRGMILANTFWAEKGRHQPAGVVVKKPLGELPGPDWTAQFHVWRMDWDASEIRLYVDDQLLNRTPITDAQRLKPGQPHPFRQPHFLLLNLAVGGQGGDPSGAEFPARFEVDYARVYQRVE